MNEPYFYVIFYREGGHRGLLNAELFDPARHMREEDFLTQQQKAAEEEVPAAEESPAEEEVPAAEEPPAEEEVPVAEEPPAEDEVPVEKPSRRKKNKE